MPWELGHTSMRPEGPRELGFDRVAASVALVGRFFPKASVAPAHKAETRLG